MDEIFVTIKKLQESIVVLKKENTELRKRVSRLEAGTDRDLRIKAKRVLGFTLSNIRGYYNAVRSVQGSQIRIYIGKNLKDDVVHKKIVDYLVDNAYWLRNDIKACDDLMAIEEIVQAVKKADNKKIRE